MEYSTKIPGSTNVLREKWFQLRRHFLVTNVSVKESVRVGMVRFWIANL
jgi:hypothetical protein